MNKVHKLLSPFLISLAVLIIFTNLVWAAPAKNTKNRAASSSERYDLEMRTGDKALESKSYAEAEKAYLQALEAAKTFPDNDPRILKTLKQQISLFYAQAKLSDAAPVMKRVIMIMENVQGIDSPAVLESLKNYKLVLQRIGDSHACDVVDNRISSLSIGGDGEHSHIANLTGVAITDVDAAFLLHGLEREIWQLNAADSQIGDKTMQLLKNFDHLERVDLSGTRISDEGLLKLKDKGTIRILTLGNTAVSDLGMPSLYSLKSLTHLGLSGTSVSASAIEALKRALPRCKIAKY